MAGKIPVSVIVATRNEEKNIKRCLAAISRFDEVIVVDSHSTDATVEIAKSLGADSILFSWNGQYPKKRQWCLDTIPLKYDRVLFVDADEEVTNDLADEIASLDWSCAGYYIDGLYVVDGRVLKFGMRNRKLCLLDRRLMEFPVVDDLNIPGMGEIEGHYQPVLKKGAVRPSIRRLASPILHYAFDDMDRWQARHAGYALWEYSMNQNKAYPDDPSSLRQIIKHIYRHIPFKGSLFFAYHYFLKGGFLEGAQNYRLTLHKKKYYDAITDRKAR